MNFTDDLRAGSARSPAGRRSPIRWLDALALELLLQGIEERGLIEGTPFRGEVTRLRRRRTGPAARFQATFRVLERIHAHRLIEGADLREWWHRVRCAHGEDTAA